MPFIIITMIALIVRIHTTEIEDHNVSLHPIVYFITYFFVISERLISEQAE